MRAILLGLLLGFGVCLLASCGKTERKQRTTGYKGEARSNAFLAAQRLLRKRGANVEKRTGLGGLDYGTAILFLEPASLNTVGRAKRLIEWVRGGGHVVLMISGGERTGNDFQMEKNSWSMPDSQPAGVGYLLGELGVRLVEWKTEPDDAVLDSMERDDWEVLPESERVLLGTEKATIVMMGEELELFHRSEIGLKYALRDGLDMGSEDVPAEDKHRFLSLVKGSGRVTLMSDGGPLRNRYLGEADHAQFLVGLVDLSRGGQIVFASGAGEGFFSLVWRYFWMAVVAMAVAVVFWLWKNLPRFGPTQDLSDGQLREFSGQLRGMGRFFWKHKRDDVLVGALRENISRRIALTSGGAHEGLFEQLSEITGLPVEQVIEAMTRQQISEPGAMVRVMRNLQQIYQKLN